MTNKVTLISPNQNSIVQIENGELISYKVENQELIHDKDVKKGWGNSDTEMFPIIGPTVNQNYLIQTPNGKGILDQHGIARLLEYTLENQTNISVNFKKTYQANTKINNPKYNSDKSKPQYVFWPYTFSLEKIFTLTDTNLIIDLVVNSPKSMPYMIGYHPAFKLSADNSELIQISNGAISLKEILDKGHNAYPILGLENMSLIHPNLPYNVNIQTKNFQNVMFWTMTNQMLCIEPITKYPELSRTTPYDEKTQSMRISSGKPETFTTTITPFK